MLLYGIPSKCSKEIMHEEDYAATYSGDSI